MEVVVEEEASPFQFGLFGLALTELEDRVLVDSYDSGLGPYGGENVGDAANIASNDDITLDTDIIVNGNAQAGGSVIGDDSGITGMVTEGVPSVTVVTDISYPAYNSDTAGISPPGAYDTSTYNLTVGSGETVTLGPGTYSFDKVTLGEDATLDVSGPVTIYMTGNFSAQRGAMINASGPDPKPTNLVIFSSASGFNAIKFHGRRPEDGGQFNGAIYALDAEIEFEAGGWQIYGSLVGWDVDLEDDAQFHYDVALARAKFRPSAGTWRELFP